MAGHPRDSLQLRREIKAAEALEERWAVIIQHENGLEVHGAGGLALPVDHRADAVRPSWWLLRDEPVACWVASSAGIDLVRKCPQCCIR